MIWIAAKQEFPLNLNNEEIVVNDGSARPTWMDAMEQINITLKLMGRQTCVVDELSKPIEPDLQK